MEEVFGTDLAVDTMLALLEALAAERSGYAVNGRRYRSGLDTEDLEEVKEQFASLMDRVEFEDLIAANFDI